MIKLGMQAHQIPYFLREKLTRFAMSGSHKVGRVGEKLSIRSCMSANCKPGQMAHCLKQVVLSAGSCMRKSRQAWLTSALAGFPAAARQWDRMLLAIEEPWVPVLTASCNSGPPQLPLIHTILSVWTAGPQIGPSYIEKWPKICQSAECIFLITLQSRVSL